MQNTNNISLEINPAGEEQNFIKFLRKNFGLKTPSDKVVNMTAAVKPKPPLKNAKQIAPDDKLSAVLSGLPDEIAALSDNETDIEDEMAEAWQAKINQANKRMVEEHAMTAGQKNAFRKLLHRDLSIAPYRLYHPLLGIEDSVKNNKLQTTELFSNENWKIKLATLFFIALVSAAALVNLAPGIASRIETVSDKVVLSPVKAVLALKDGVRSSYVYLTYGIVLPTPPPSLPAYPPLNGDEFADYIKNNADLLNGLPAGSAISVTLDDLHGNTVRLAGDRGDEVKVLGAERGIFDRFSENIILWLEALGDKQIQLSLDLENKFKNWLK